MTIVAQRRRSGGGTYEIPTGGEILWFGIASALPAGWSIDSFAADLFVRGADQGEATDTPAESFNHGHTNPTATALDGNHTHPIGGGSTGSASGSDNFFPSGSIGTAPSGHTHSIPTGTSGSGGQHSHTLSAAVALDVFPPYARLYWIKATADSPIPVNGVIMFDNPIGSRPLGFEICDGANGTPDMRDNFVYGAGADEDVGTSGGSETHVHQNSGSGSDGAHTHTLQLNTGGSGSNSNGSGFQGIETSPSHGHGINLTSDSDTAHSHSLGATDPATSLPSFMKLYYLMRLV